MRMPAAFSAGGACGVAAVCRRSSPQACNPGPGRLLAAGLQGPVGTEGSLCRPPVLFYVAGPGGDRSGGLCGDTWGCVCPSAHGATGRKPKRSFAGHILRPRGKVDRRRVTSRSRSTFPPGPFRTGHAVFTASGSPVSLQGSRVWSVLALQRSADFWACGPQKECLKGCREGDGHGLTRIQVDRVGQV